MEPSGRMDSQSTDGIRQAGSTTEPERVQTRRRKVQDIRRIQLLLIHLLSRRGPHSSPESSRSYLHRSTYHRFDLFLHHGLRVPLVVLK